MPGADARRGLRVLNIEDSVRDGSLLQRHLANAGYDLVFERVDTPSGMKTALEKDWDVILADYSMPAFSALEALALLQQTGRDIPFIVISGTIGEESAVEAMRAGAADYLLKGKLTRLSAAIERELQEAKNRLARRRAEKELTHLTEEVERQRDRLNTIISSVPGLVWEAWGEPDAATQRMNFASDYVNVMLGYSVQEWVSTPNFWLSIVHPDDRDQAGREAAANFAANRSSTQVFRWIRKDGRILWVESNYSVISGPDGKPAGLRGVTIDITERREAEGALRDSEERYRQLFESNPDSTFVFDRETLRFFAINEAAVQEYGYSREELSSLTAKDIGSLDERPGLLDRLSESPHGPPRGTIWKHRKKDGTLIDVEITLRPLAFAGRDAWVLLAHNVTDQKLLEEQLRQSQKMDAIGQLAGGMAHDFNNLLTVIGGYSDLAIDGLPPEDPLRKDLEQIKRAGQRAAALTRQLLAFSRKQVLLPAIIDLNALISELKKMLLRLIGEDIDLLSELAPESVIIKADHGQIEQVIMNLVVNARDAMPTGGKLIIETLSVDLTEDYTRQHPGLKPGPYVMLAVTDTGIGMDAGLQSRMFEPFFTTKEVGKGTGLGLSTVYGIVQQSGGTIAVDSEPGRGTTFRIYLPRADDNALDHERTGKLAGVAPGTETILLTEDDDMVRALTARILSTHGYRVLEAANGEAALSAFEWHAEHIHLLVTDIVMPEIYGIDLANRLRKLRPELKVLYMSGFTDRAIVKQVLDEKAVFIQKPFAPEALLIKVREALDSSDSVDTSSGHAPKAAGGR